MHFFPSAVTGGYLACTVNNLVAHDYHDQVDGAPAGAQQQAAGGGGGSNGGGMTNSRTRTVPSSPLARVFGFGQLAAGLAMGTVAEAVRQSVGGGNANGAQNGGGQSDAGQRRSSVKQYVASDANAERLAETLCRMRGAALKLGQMLSIQVTRHHTTRACRRVFVFFHGLSQILQVAVLSRQKHSGHCCTAVVVYCCRRMHGMPVCLRI